ncbi:hypothetical protein [Sorangium sp. So ce233]|uniref:hypothetical protein n=1 Tax=Sorangium sp. So ce233 TaxID=3133290 RepID=UPI003F620585
MDLERAKEITAQCLRNRMQFILGSENGSYVPLPDCSLEEMLVANRLVEEANAKASSEAKPDANGKMSYQVHMVVDPRGIAASYAFERFGKNPHDYLEAIGLRLRRPGDDDDHEDAEDEDAPAACG